MAEEVERWNVEKALATPVAIFTAAHATSLVVANVAADGTALAVAADGTANVVAANVAANVAADGTALATEASSFPS